MKRLLILSFSLIKRDPRVMRQIKSLAGKYEVTVAGFGKKPDVDVDYIELDAPVSNSLLYKSIAMLRLTCGFFLKYYWNIPHVKVAHARLSGMKYDLIVANDITALPLVINIKANAKVLFDAHEYSPREFEDRFIWKLFFARYYYALCKMYLHKADRMTTVCKGIADEYRKVFEVSSDIIFNAPRAWSLEPGKVEDHQVKMIHHGVAAPSRNLERMIEMVDLLDQRFTLDFMLVSSDDRYYERIKSLAAENKRIRFLPPVEMENICPTINRYDIGVFLLPPANFNYQHALPNKFFEFIQARLAVAIGPSPEMAKLVQQHACGVVAESFSAQALADALNQLTSEQIQHYKQASDLAATKLNDQESEQVLLKNVMSLIGP